MTSAPCARPAIHGTSQLAKWKGESVMSATAVEIPGYVAGTYTIDPGHSDVAFTVRHLMVSKVRGHFTRFQGQLTLAPDPLASSVTATIELASIDTNSPQRDADLRSASFLETDTYPAMTFRSTGIGHSEDGLDVSGGLTLHGVTRPVTLALDVNGFTRDPYGGTRAGFPATTELNRGDFGISTNIPVDGGGVVIGDRIQVFIEIEAVLNPPQPASH
jgi:polyisoprenoid-binding protein YceI